MASKKITDLTATTSITADDLVIVVDMAGPTTYKMTIADFTNNIPSNTRFAANVTATLNLSGNTAQFSGNVSVDSANFFIANNLIAKKSTTPATSTTSVTTGLTGLMWTDGSYIYVQANNTHYKRVAVSTF